MQRLSRCGSSEGGLRPRVARFSTGTKPPCYDGLSCPVFLSCGGCWAVRSCRHAEMHLNSRELELPHSPEFSMFLNILCVLQDQFRLCAFRTEVSPLHCGLCLAGQADALFVDQSGAITILDWKRTQRIRFDGFGSLREPINHLPDANGWQYCLQLNIYKCPAVSKVFAQPD